MADSEVTIAQVRQQVHGLERGYTELRQELHSVEQKMDKGFSAITSKLDEKSSPQWQAYTLIVTVLLAIGGALYYPIKVQAEKQEARTEQLAHDFYYLQGQLHPLEK